MARSPSWSLGRLHFPATATLWFVTFVLCIRHLRADVGLRFVRAPEPIVAPPGDEVVFECSLNVPAEQVRWRHDGIFLNHTVHNGRSPQSNNHLVVRVADQRQAGDYQCVAWYGASALASVPARLSLAEMGSFPESPNKHLDVYTGNTVTIHCSSPPSNPPAVLQYMKNGIILSESAQIISSTGSLVLQNVTSDDEGIYSCSATNYITGNTIASPQQTILKVTNNRQPEAAKFLYTTPENYTAQNGMNITLECSGVGQPVPTMVWRKVNGIFPNRAQRIPGGLFIPNLESSDRGIYACELSNGIGSQTTRYITLTLQEPPTLISEPPSISVVQESESCQLECQFRGEPSPEIFWLLNGELVSKDPLIAAKDGTLKISRLEKRHAGIYQCMAANAVGTAYGSAMLQVKPQQIPARDAPLEADDPQIEDHNRVHSGLTTTAPGHHQSGKKDHRRGRPKDNKKHKGTAVMIPPTKPHITRLSDESVMVRWNVPPNDGLPIQFFKVQYRELGNGKNRGGGRGRGNRWMTSNEDIPPYIRSYEITNLEPDHIYRFRIAAVYSNNDNKLGPNSARFHLHRGSTVMKHDLNTPIFVHAEAVSPSAIQINWQYTPSATTQIDGFYVYYRATSSAGDYVKATVEGEQTRAYNITHLQSDTPYDIKLQSFTVGAASDFSAIRTHRTLREPTTKPPPPVEEGPTVSPGAGTSTNNQLYMVLGAVLGGLGLLLVLFLLLYFCNRNQHNSQEASHATSVTTHETIDRDKNMDPVVNGFALNGKGSGPNANHSNTVNGRLQSNGLHIHANTITITGNPLDASDHDKKHNAMEMTFLSTPTNNNSCSMAQRTTRTTSPTGSGMLPPAPAPPPLAMRPPTLRSTRNRDIEHITNRPGENYV